MAHPFALPAAEQDDRPTVSIFWLKRALCPESFRDRRLVAYLTLLIDQHDFPPPLPSLVRLKREPGARGIASPSQRLTSDVTMNSRWRRDAVDVWLADFLPPDAAAALDGRARAVAAAEMDAAAGHLHLIQGGRE